MNPASPPCYLLELPESIQLDVMDSVDTKEDAMRIIHEIWGGKSKTPTVPKNLDVRKVNFSGFKGSSSSESTLKHIDGNRYEFIYDGKRYPARCDPLDSVVEGYKIRGLACQISNVGKFTHLVRVFETESEFLANCGPPLENGICNRTLGKPPFHTRMELAGVQLKYIHKAVEQLMNTATKIEGARRNGLDATFVREQDAERPQPWMFSNGYDDDEILLNRGKNGFQESMFAAKERMISKQIT